MDDINKKILEILEQDGRITHEEIGHRLNISRPAVHQRVRKLEEEGYIKNYKAVIDWKKLGQNIETIIYLKINSSNFSSLAQKIVSVKVTGVYLKESIRLAGEWCMMLRVRSSTPEEITQYIDALWEIDGVKETSTNFILSTIYTDGDY